MLPRAGVAFAGCGSFHGPSGSAQGPTVRMWYECAGTKRSTSRLGTEKESYSAKTVHVTQGRSPSRVSPAEELCGRWGAVLRDIWKPRPEAEMARRNLIREGLPRRREEGRTTFRKRLARLQQALGEGGGGDGRKHRPLFDDLTAGGPPAQRERERQKDTEPKWLGTRATSITASRSASHQPTARDCRSVPSPPLFRSLLLLLGARAGWGKEGTYLPMALSFHV